MPTPRDRPTVLRHLQSHRSGDNNTPHNALREIDGKSSDLMAGQGGKYSWLVPEWTETEQVEGMTNIHFAHCGSSRDGWADLAEGAGGSYVYLEADWNHSTSWKVSDIKLMRSDNALTLDNVRARGYSAMSNDINSGRGHDFLYVIWNVANVG
ncbi:hypothetical protein AB5N19_00159 [Seiridium cardinale]|uniref:Uncharacterized protein n=1 Tax=Seiridium cardinale TaxID=138064 RepID=A0ABR2XHZ5_9PEZI